MFLLRVDSATKLPTKTATVRAGRQKLEASGSLATTSHSKIVIRPEVPESGIAQSRTYMLSK